MSDEDISTLEFDIDNDVTITAITSLGGLVTQVSSVNHPEIMGEPVAVLAIYYSEVTGRYGTMWVPTHDLGKRVKYVQLGQILVNFMKTLMISKVVHEPGANE